VLADHEAAVADAHVRRQGPRKTTRAGAADLRAISGGAPN
jgi:hypothetical protein